MTLLRALELLLLAGFVALTAVWLYRNFLQLPNLSGGLLDLEDDRYLPFKGKRMTVPGVGADVARTSGARAEFFTRRAHPGVVYVRELDPRVKVEQHEIARDLVGERQVRRLDKVVIGRARLALAQHRRRKGSLR